MRRHIPFFVLQFSFEYLLLFGVSVYLHYVDTISFTTDCCYCFAVLCGHSPYDKHHSNPHNINRHKY
jgi:hypothetical protein